ncbi:hypothetical protein [Inquilinus limosus]|uniref:Uncharacterized protein n=1 Tax=Inquilinus limosus MP06 TaxID=1398085 RepID=A0A0A0DBN5_9PROT|nr:hypothetical protein [Inquilinus limosus]KGM36131.1 hypothetical protein P409_00350 [Inquilinus limosus MP06]
MTDLYESAQASVLNICKNFATETGGGMAVFKFDAHAETNSWPNNDVIGPAEFQVEVNVGILEIETLIGISTLNDTNIVRLDKLISRLFTKLQPDKMFPFLDAGNGAPMGMMKVKSPVVVLPVARTETRPVKFIGLSLGTDRAFGA